MSHLPGIFYHLKHIKHQVTQMYALLFIPILIATLLLSFIVLRPLSDPIAEVLLPAGEGLALRGTSRMLLDMGVVGRDPKENPCNPGTLKGSGNLPNSCVNPSVEASVIDHKN